MKNWKKFEKELRELYSRRAFFALFLGNQRHNILKYSSAYNGSLKEFPNYDSAQNGTSQAESWTVTFFLFAIGKSLNKSKNA